MKNISLVFILSLVSLFSFSQYITPGNGVTWNLVDLVDNSGGVITNNEGIYYINGDLTVSETDTIRIISDEVIKIDNCLRSFSSPTAHGDSYYSNR